MKNTDPAMLHALTSELTSALMKCVIDFSKKRLDDTSPTEDISITFQGFSAAAAYYVNLILQNGLDDYFPKNRKIEVLTALKKKMLHTLKYALEEFSYENIPQEKEN